MADRLGDPTARAMGRMSLNPVRHFDLFGSVSLLLVGIGWAKPCLLYTSRGVLRLFRLRAKAK